MATAKQARARAAFKAAAKACKGTSGKYSACVGRHLRSR